MPSRKAPTWIVEVNGQPVNYLQPVRVQRSLNGERMDYAELVVDTNNYPTFNGLDDFTPYSLLDKYIDIQSSLGPYVHRGVVIQVVPTFSEASAGITVVSRTQPHQFGLTLFGQVHFHPVTGNFVHSDDDLVFNPTIDGKTFGNKHDSKTFGSNNIPIFLDPEGARTAAARTLNGGRNTSWLLSEVLYYLCWMANRNETFLVNPTLDELQSAVIDSVDLVRNLKVRAGSTLPKALDDVLIQLGYHWRIVQTNPFALNQLQIIRKATGGNLRKVYHQRMRQPLSTALTNTEALGVRFDTSRLTNQIVAKGRKMRVEFTAELHRGWPASLDDEPRESLALAAAKQSENPDKINAWRKWVLNESGDYIGTRPSITGIFTSALQSQLSGEDLIQYFLPRRRKLMPTLTLNEQKTAPVGDVNGIIIEYRDYDGSWKSAKQWGFDVLDTECGLYLRGENIPEELYDQGDYGKIRITASIDADYKVTRVSERQPNSPVLEIAECYMDLEDNFQHNIILSGSKYASGDNNLSTDDSTPLASFADSLRDRFDQIDVPGGIVLEGVDNYEYQPGDRISGVDGKNISFESKQGSGNFPQIVSVTLDINEQKTVLQVQRFREFRA